MSVSLELSDEPTADVRTAVEAALAQHAAAAGVVDRQVRPLSIVARGNPNSRLGYSMMGMLQNFPAGHTRFFMEKHLG